MGSTSPRILVIGFGPFLEVVDNPAARLARAVDGARAGTARITGREMPVSYARSPGIAVALAEEMDADVVIGVGVARGRLGAWVERYGQREADPVTPDVDGAPGGDLEPGGPSRVESTIDVARFAEELAALVSEDAGRYVCNGWLYRTVRAMPGHRLVGFLHVPDEGVSPETLLRGLEAAWGR